MPNRRTVPVVRLMKLRRVIVLSWCLGACFMAYNYRPPACVFLIQRCLPHFQNWLGTSNTDRSDHSGSDDRPFAPMASHVRIRRVMIPAYTWISEARRYWKGGGLWQGLFSEHRRIFAKDFATMHWTRHRRLLPRRAHATRRKLSAQFGIARHGAVCFQPPDDKRAQRHAW